MSRKALERSFDYSAELGTKALKDVAIDGYIKYAFKNYTLFNTNKIHW
jgi:hypothetical protein